MNPYCCRQIQFVGSSGNNGEDDIRSYKFGCKFPSGPIFIYWIVNIFSREQDLISNIKFQMAAMLIGIFHLSIL